MIPRDRVLQAMGHQQTDIVPYNIQWDDGVREAYVQASGDPDFDKGVVNHFEFLGVSEGTNIRDIEKADDETVDDWGCRFKHGNIFHITEPRLPSPTMTGYEFPELTELSRYSHWDQRIRISQASGRFVIAAYWGGPFERGWMLRGMEAWLMDLMDNEPFVNELLDGTTDVLMGFVETAGTFEGIDSIMIGDDQGQQRGLMMNPSIWRKLFKPRMAKLFKRIHDHGKYVAIHSCGDNSAIMEDLIEIGLDIFNPLQPEAMDIVEMKRLYGDRLTFNGGIGTQGALVYGTPEQVREEVSFILKKIGSRGGLVAETTKPIRGDVPAANIDALIDVLTNQA